MKKFFPIFIFLLIITGLSAQTQNNQSALNGVIDAKLTVDQVRNPRSNAMYNPYVVDMCNAFTSSEIERMTAILKQVEMASTTQIIVVALPGIEGDNEDDFAYSLFNEWGIGQKGKDNGLLVLYVKDIRAIKFETGYGLEGYLPDAYLSDVMYNTMFPLLKEGKTGEAFINALQQISEKLNSEEFIHEMLVQEVPIRYKAVNVLCYWMIISILVTLLFVFSIYKNTNVKEDDKDKKFIAKGNDKSTSMVEKVGGELSALATTTDSKSKNKIAGNPIETDIYLAKKIQFFKFLGFMFPTLFLLGIYLKNLKKELRLAPQTCPQCGGKMHLIKPEEAKQYFTKRDEVENKLHSVDFNYWECDSCHNHKKMAYPIPGSKYTQCPNCGAYACSIISNRIALAPTTTHSGTKELVHRCDCCQHTYTTTQVLPKLASGGGSSFGGGSFSGGSSFGGGRSGGGGVSGRF